MKKTLGTYTQYLQLKFTILFPKIHIEQIFHKQPLKEGTKLNY